MNDNVKSNVEAGERISVPVKCMENGKVYKSCSDACQDLGLSRGTVSKALREGRHEACGYTFFYLSRFERDIYGV